MISLGFLFGSLPGFILLCCLLGIGGLLYFMFRIYFPKRLDKMRRIDD
jgi:hypothetical protein